MPVIPLKYQLWFYYGALACVAMAVSMHDSTFNNFLAETFHLSADARGHLEFPRELPGFLVVTMTGLLCMLPLTRVGLVATLLSTAGLVSLALYGISYPFMIVSMVAMSAGVHLLQPVGASIVIGLSGEHNRGARLGQAAAVSTIFTALGTGLVWLFMDRTAPQYQTTFLCAAGVFLCGGLFYALMHIPHLHQPRQRLVFRKAYRLYYLLEFLSGARKQIFLTFGPWVLIKVYGLPAPSIAGLLMVSCLIGIVFKPLAGMVMDYTGERVVMIAEGLVLVVVCLGYGYAQWLIADPGWARRLACCCFILDEMLFALGNARALYLSRLAPSPQELNSSLAMGVSINHVASMLIPTVAGAIWVGLGYERLFLGAAAFALVLAGVASLVPRSGRRFSKT
ncbi:MAG: MFS transporter [Candidatus Hydrogenedentes bacterium]|nr:MFS transporter [Candidatus Hydrogenedentota bacterium]